MISWVFPIVPQIEAILLRVDSGVKKGSLFISIDDAMVEGAFEHVHTEDREYNDDNQR
jgi:hypothetical protein